MKKSLCILLITCFGLTIFSCGEKEESSSTTLQVDYMLRLVSQEPSLPQQIQPLGLQERLGHQIIFGHTPTETMSQL